MKKCLVLVSGGLDSALAAALMKEHGLAVEAANCVTGFEPAGRGVDHVRLVTANLGIPLHRLDIREQFLEIVRSPRFGYGKNLNPCLDCKIIMLRSAWCLAGQIGAGFLVTGEVLGQRPMSQQAGSLDLIERKAGLEGRIFRPLSAALLPETLPEKEGLVDRARWPAFAGRNRRDLIDLAARKGVTGFSPPAGGCLLTDRIFSRRLRDLMDHGRLDTREVELLRVGRHLRFSPSVKLVVGRDEKENLFLEERSAGKQLLVSEGSGPSALLSREAGPGDLERAAAVVASYSDEGRGGRPLAVRVAGRSEPLLVEKAPPRDKWRPFLV